VDGGLYGRAIFTLHLAVRSGYTQKFPVDTKLNSKCGPAAVA